jgi:hypothetical protein
MPEALASQGNGVSLRPISLDRNERVFVQEAVRPILVLEVDQRSDCLDRGG